MCVHSLGATPNSAQNSTLAPYSGITLVNAQNITCSPGDELELTACNLSTLTLVLSLQYKPPCFER